MHGPEGSLLGGICSSHAASIHLHVLLTRYFLTRWRFNLKWVLFHSSLITWFRPQLTCQPSRPHPAPPAQVTLPSAGSEKTADLCCLERPPKCASACLCHYLTVISMKSGTMSTFFLTFYPQHPAHTWPKKGTQWAREWKQSERNETNIAPRRQATSLHLGSTWRCSPLLKSRRRERD